MQNAFFLEVTTLLDGLLVNDGNKPLALGVGCAGPMHNHSEVSPLNIPGPVPALPLRRRLEDRYDMPIFLELDTKALALAEGWKGVASGSSNYLAMVVSSGIGGGLVLDGRLVEGRTGNAGHVGHIIVEPGGRPCSCGGRGCLESEASGWAIASITGRPPSEASGDMVHRTGRLVGEALASVANLCDLDLFVVAGLVVLQVTASRSFKPLRRHCMRTPSSRTPGVPASSLPGWATERLSWVPLPLHGEGLVRSC